ncbi:putative membrane protein YobI [Pedobacter psychrotolerans]|nr:putative membrane protein YobI [Pedobacter psychrotolerans]
MIIFSAGVIYIGRAIINFLYTSKFSKINLTSGEIEISKDIDGSVLNKYLDEIIYFFEKTKYDVVIIEDLDRFNDPEIFTKLREINMMINNSEQIHPMRVKFIYAIKDDIFQDKNRTKFFDFIIPVIPHLTAANSLDVLLPKMAKLNLNPPFNQKFLYDIMLFVDDMRILINTYNEFVLYQHNLKHPENQLVPEKLFGIMVYKNLFPNDFAKLHIREGDIPNTFDRKASYIIEQSKILDAEMLEIEEQLEKNGLEKLQNLAELRKVFIMALISTFPTALAIEVSGRKTFTELQQETVFDELRLIPNIHYYTRTLNDTQTPSKISFAEVERKADAGDYVQRRQIIISSAQDNQGKLRNRRDEIAQMLKRINSAPLKSLFKDNKKAHEFFPTLVKKPILRYLISGGYIDEMYEIYISHFYNKSLTATDLVFLKKLKNLEKSNYAYSIQKPVELLHRMADEDFLLEEALNFKLLDFLIQNKATYSIPYNNIFKLLADDSTTSLEFTRGYLSITKNITGFIEKITTAYPKFWWTVRSLTKYGVDQQLLIMTTMIKHCDMNTIHAQNTDESIKHYLQGDTTDFILQFPNKKDHHRVMNTVRNLNVHFQHMTSAAFSSPLFKSIYEQKFFTVSYDMIKLMFRFCVGKNPIAMEEFENANLTTIKKYNCQPLFEHIEYHLDLYVSLVSLEMENNKNESVEIIKMMLSKLKNEENRLKVIEHQKTTLPSFKDIDVSLWSTLVENNKILSKWKNIEQYYVEKGGLDQEMIMYINKTKTSMLLWVDDIDITINSKAHELLLSIINEPKITDTAFTMLIGKIRYKFEAEDIFSSAPEAHLRMLIDNGNIVLNSFNFNALSTFENDLKIALVKKNFSSFSKQSEIFSLVSQEWVRLIQLKPTNTQKEKIISMIPISSITGYFLANQLTKLLLAKNGKRTEFDFIVKLFGFGNNPMDKVKLLNLYGENYSKEQLRELLLAMGGKYEKISPGSFPRLDANPDHKRMLSLLYDKKLVKEFPLRNNKFVVLPAK